MYYDTEEVAKLLGFTRETVRRKINNGEIASIKIRDKHKIPKDEVRKYLYNMINGEISEDQKNELVNEMLKSNA